ncbi:hypothetical protein P5V15_007255 [Pogonomyrmex californicus]
MTHSVTQPWATNEDEYREMMVLWPDVVRKFADAANTLNASRNVRKSMAEVLQYDVRRGEKTRGLTVVYAYRLLASNNQLTEDNIRLARILGWCVKLFQAYLFLFDDIQYRSLLRRSLPRWYRDKDFFTAVIYNGLMIECCLNFLIQEHFREKECYIDLEETFQDIMRKTIESQLTDFISTNFYKKPNLDLFTMDQYNKIVKYKTSNYSFILPVTAAMHFAGIKDPEIFKQAKIILLKMGHLFQVQDDYLACFGNPEVFGKDNTDIQKGKCTWLIVTTLDRATLEQRKILEECYGSSDPEKVRRVKQLFIDLELPNAYSMYEEETYNLLNEHIQRVSRELPDSLFLDLLGKLYRRVN